MNRRMLFKIKRYSSTDTLHGLAGYESTHPIAVYDRWQIRQLAEKTDRLFLEAIGEPKA